MIKAWILVLMLSIIIGCSDQKKQNETTSLTEMPVVNDRALTSKSQKMQVGAIGKIAPVGTLYSMDSTVIRTDTFKGKVLVIDFWATWCAPCLVEKPAFDSLKNKMKEEQVEFISISVNTEFPFWRNYLNENEWSGNNYWLGSEESNVFFSLVYSEIEIKGVPTVLIGLPKYVILGTNGVIINNGAPKPTNPELEREIRKALKSPT